MSLVKTYYTTGHEEQGIFKTFANFESMSCQNVQTTFLHPSSKKPTLEVAKVDNFDNCSFINRWGTLGPTKT